MDIKKYWQAVLCQNPGAMEEFFEKEACVNWHNTNEHFSADEFIRVNCEYPGQWDGELVRIEQIGDLIITVAHVWEKEKKVSFHVTSFIRTENDKIKTVDEYWGDDGAAPEWRREKRIGGPISHIDGIPLFNE